MSELNDKTGAEANTELVTAIQLTRIYDVLILVLHELNPEASQKLTDLHEEGSFLSPAPAIMLLDDPGGGEKE